MKTLQLECGRCRTRLSFPLREASVRTNCPVCDTYMRVEAFPALLQKTAPGSRGEALLVADESSCFYHPTKKAVVPCANCGRFLCSLCDIEMEGRHLCSTCIKKGAEKGKLEQLQTTGIRYDDLALTLAIVPLIFYCITLFTAPAALYIAIRYWKTPTSIVPRRKWRYVVAIFLALCQVAAWGFFGARLLERMLISA